MTEGNNVSDLLARLDMMAETGFWHRQIPADAAARIRALEAALADALSGLRYVRVNYPDVTGVGFDRCEAYRKLIEK